MKVVGISKEYNSILKETNIDFQCLHGMERYTLWYNIDNKKIGLKLSSIKFSRYGGSKYTMISFYLGKHQQEQDENNHRIHPNFV